MISTLRYVSACIPSVYPNATKWPVIGYRALAYACTLAPLATSFILDTPAGALISGEEVTIFFTKQPGDPETFSLELVNPGFEAAFAIANNVLTSAGDITLTLPEVPPR